MRNTRYDDETNFGFLERGFSPISAYSFNQDEVFRGHPNRLS
jgi:hypothetical protein